MNNLNTSKVIRNYNPLPDSIRNWKSLIFSQKDTIFLIATYCFLCSKYPAGKSELRLKAEATDPKSVFTILGTKHPGKARAIAILRNSNSLYLLSQWIFLLPFTFMWNERPPFYCYYIFYPLSEALSFSVVDADPVPFFAPPFPCKVSTTMVYLFVPALFYLPPLFFLNLLWNCLSSLNIIVLCFSLLISLNPSSSLPLLSSCSSSISSYSSSASSSPSIG